MKFTTHLLVQSLKCMGPCLHIPCLPYTIFAWYVDVLILNWVCVLLLFPFYMGRWIYIYRSHRVSIIWLNVLSCFQQKSAVCVHTWVISISIFSIKFRRNGVNSMYKMCWNLEQWKQFRTREVTNTCHVLCCSKCSTAAYINLIKSTF